LGVKADEGLAGSAGYAGEPEAGAAAEARHVAAGHLPAAQHQPKGTGALGVSLPAAERQNHPAQPSVGRGHHLPAQDPGGPLLGGSGLAQPVGASLAAVEHLPIRLGSGSGGGLLRRGAGGSLGPGPARGVKHRPEQPVHQLRVYSGPAGPERADQHGRQEDIPGQHLRGAAVADGEV